MAVQHLESDYFLPELAQLLATARKELDLHVNQDGTCSICELAWPCEPACLAAFTLGGL
jgi:hypothetical protein